MLVYRIETVEGVGPYNLYGNYNPSRCYGPRHPGPDRDGIPWKRLSRKHSFGFRTMAMLKDWFDLQTRKDMAKARYNHNRKRIRLVIAVYDAKWKDVIFGKHQMVFEKKKARLCCYKDIVTGTIIDNLDHHFSDMWIDRANFYKNRTYDYLNVPFMECPVPKKRGVTAQEAILDSNYIELKKFATDFTTPIWTMKPKNRVKVLPNSIEPVWTEYKRYSTADVVFPLINEPKEEILVKKIRLNNGIVTGSKSTGLYPKITI